MLRNFRRIEANVKTFYSPLRHSKPSLWNDTQFREAGCQRCTQDLAHGTPLMPHPRVLSSPHCTLRPRSHSQRQGHLGMKKISHHILFVLPVEKNHIWLSTWFAKCHVSGPSSVAFLQKNPPPQNKRYKRRSLSDVINTFQSKYINYVNKIIS